MRRHNLIRVIAVGLCVLLALSGVISAAFYSDAGDIPNYAVAAVDTMYKLGIMQGADGLLRPDDPLTREEMFRLVFSMTNAGRAQVDPMYENMLAVSTLSDIDTISPWARGFAGYVLINQIFRGSSDGRLNPGGNLTYLECAIVLLRILGYRDSSLTAAGLSTAEWREKVMNYAEQAGLLTGLPVGSTTRYSGAPITRQDIAIMIYNALAAKTVTLYEETYITTGETPLRLYYGVVTENHAKVADIIDDGDSIFYLMDNGDQIPADPHGQGAQADETLLGKTVIYVTSDKNPWVLGVTPADEAAEDADRQQQVGE